MVIDVRETPRYLGQTEPIDLIAGHIPGAANLPYTLNLDATANINRRRFTKAYKKLLGDVQPDDVIVHCGSGLQPAILCWGWIMPASAASNYMSARGANGQKRFADCYR